MDNELLELIKQKEEADKRLLNIELVMMYITVFTLLALTFVVCFIKMDESLAIILTLIGVIPVIVASFFAIRIEQKAGYYKCDKCNYKYIPKYISVLFAPHIGRTRYMKSPKCSNRSWHKKVLNK